MRSAILDSAERQAGILDQILAIGQTAQQHITEDPKKVYELIAEAVCKTTEADCAVLYPYHPAFGEFYDLVNVAAYGLRHELQVDKRTNKRKGLTARVHTKGEIICENVEEIEWEEARPYKDTPLIAREEIKAFMGLSLTLGENVLGILYIDYRSPHHFSEDEKRIIRLFGQQAALAVSNSWTDRLAAIRADTVARLKTIGQSLVTIEDPPETLDSVLRGIAHSAQEVLDADLVDLYQYIQDRNEFVLPPTLVGDRWDPFVSKDKIYDDDVVMRVVKIGEPQYSHDAQGTSLLTGEFEVPRDDAPDKRFVVREGVASSAMIPLMAVDETVGVMFVNYRTPQFFAPGQQAVIESFAAQAAIAIQNQRLFGESLRQRNELEVVDEVGKLLMATLDPREIPRLLLQKVIRLFGVEGASLWRIDQASRTVKCVFSLDRRGDEESFAEVMRKQIFEFGEGIVGTVAQSGEAMVASEVRAEPRWSERVDEATGFRTRSVLAVPLVYQQETIGVIEVLNRLDETPFTQDDCDFLAAIVSPAAIALENARLFYEVNQTLERRVEALTALNEVGQTLTSGIRLKEDEILELIYEQARRLTNAQDMYIALYDDESKMIRFGLAIEGGDRVEIAKPRKADMEKRGKTEELILTRQPLLHRTLQEAKDWYALPGHQKYIGRVSPSWLGVPMMVGEKVLGVIALLNQERENAFDELDLQVLASMANPAAIALDNATLYYEVNQALERRVEALSALNEVGQALTSDIRLSEDEILELIYEQARRLTDAQDMYIALYDDATQMIRFGLAIEGGQHVEIAEPRKADMQQRGRIEEIIFTRQPLLHKTQQEAEDWYASPGHQEFIGHISLSWLGVPMMVGERVLGVIAIFDWEQEHAYDELDLQVLASMASQAAIAIDSARLFESTRQIAHQRQRRLELLQQISERMAEASLDPDEVLELVADGANDVTSSDLTSIYRYDQEASNFTRGVQVSPGRDVEQITSDDLPDPDEVPARIAQTQEAVFVEDVGKSTEKLTFARRHRLKAVAGLPLTIVGPQGMPATVGVLFLNFKEPHTFSEDEQEILRHLANQAAVAIAYAGAQESAQAKEQLAALGTAAATLQHRLGNTINVILPAVMRLRYRVGDDPDNMEILDTIERNALFATEVIRRMQTPLRQEPFILTNINGLLRDAIQKVIQDTDRFPDIRLASNMPGLTRDGLEPAGPPQEQIAITTDLDESLPETYASSGQLTEVFRVLVENAIKAIYPHSGSVTILSKFEDDHLRPCVEITVSDTGKGIDEKTRPRLFHQPVPRKEFGEGAGLGLWLSNIIVRSHQGSIELQSTELNKGSTFLVRLPVLRQAPPSPTSQRGEIS